MSKKAILHELQVFELSAVDKPAQEGARFVIAKRADPLDTDGDGEGKTISKSPDTNEGGTMTEAEKKELEAKLEKAAADLAATEGTVAILKAENAMNDAEKAFYKSLDDGDAAAFLKMDAEERATEIEKAKSEDRVLYKDAAGTEYRKSDGALVIALAKKADEQAVELAKLRDTNELASLEKRASTDLAKYKGDTPVKVAVLKALDGIKDEATRKAAYEMLKSSDNGVGAALVKLGTGAPGEDKAEGEAALDKMAKDYATANTGVTYAKAYDIVIGTPEGRAIYNELYGFKGVDAEAA